MYEHLKGLEMSIQKFIDQKRGDSSSGDITNNEVLRAAAEAGRKALERTNKILAEQPKHPQFRWTRVCTCGSWSCSIGPFTLVQVPL